MIADMGTAGVVNPPDLDRETLRGPALRYFGAKWRLASWIISHFPEHTCYVEPFGGSAAVLLRKPKSSYEVYNDMCGDVVNFFRVLRERPRELMRQLRYTPYSREEYENAYHPCIDPLERARRFFVLAWMGYGGPRRESLTGWKTQKRRWHSGRADQITEWQKAKLLGGIARRLRDVQIDSRDALEVIKFWDAPGTLFYVDPPYPSNTRNKRWCKKAYNFEMDGLSHSLLADALKRIKGKAIVSSYPNDSYDEMYKGWRKEKKTAQNMNKGISTEVLYISPNCEVRNG